jgi:hypothetical protein
LISDTQTFLLTELGVRPLVLALSLVGLAPIISAGSNFSHPADWATESRPVAE